MTKIKICGLYRPVDIDSVNQAKPDWCGFIINFPRSHRSVTPDQARELRRKLDPAVVPVGDVPLFPLQFFLLWVKMWVSIQRLLFKNTMISTAKVCGIFAPWNLLSSTL